MWREYMGITFKIPKFTDLHYIPGEKFNLFVFTLIKNTYEILQETHKLETLVEISSLSKKIKERIYLKTYEFIFFNDLKRQKETIFEKNKKYLEKIEMKTSF